MTCAACTPGTVAMTLRSAAIDRPALAQHRAKYNRARIAPPTNGIENAAERCVKCRLSDGNESQQRPNFQPAPSSGAGVTHPPRLAPRAPADPWNPNSLLSSPGQLRARMPRGRPRGSPRVAWGREARGPPARVQRGAVRPLTRPHAREAARSFPPLPPFALPPGVQGEIPPACFSAVLVPRSLTPRSPVPRVRD